MLFNGTGSAARRSAPILIGLLCLTSLACGEPAATLRVATTTSVENSGLLAEILPEFERQHQVRVEVLAVGSGQALNLVGRGDATVGLTHDPAAEGAALTAGRITRYRKVMFNDFIIVGPQHDPAGIAKAPDAVDALRRIAATGTLFVSRDDGSGTSSREQELWARVGPRPSPARLETGQGMGATLRVTSEREAYTLTDRGTFEQFRSSLRLGLLYEGGSDLLNTYAIFLRSGSGSAVSDRGAAFADWLTDGEGRQLIAGFEANGQKVFEVWPSGLPRDRPGDLPDAASAHAR
jgi:tungstate transport system substrate-binding protein